MENRSLLQSFAMDKDGRIRSVDEVARGAACDCVCPSCGAPLLARQGEIREWHFAHTNEADCGSGAESALHLAAKQLIKDSGGLSAPAFTVDKHVRLPDGRKGHGSATRPECWIDLDVVELEKVAGEFRPDVIADANGQTLYIEIAVTHFADETKCNGFRSLGVPSIEIDLSSLHGDRWTWELLETYVIESAVHKKWLHPLYLVALEEEATSNAIAAALAAPTPAPISEVPSQLPPKAARKRYWVGSRMVDVIEHPFGIAVWTPYDPTINELIKGLTRRLGGRWQPRFKSWLFPIEAKECLVKELQTFAQSRP